MYRVLLNVSRTCPIPALCWELGGIQMRYRVIQTKLIFLWHLDNLEDGTLAKDILEVQKSQHLPGLVQECLEWLKILKLPNVLEQRITKTQWKNLVKKAILKKNEDDLRKKIMKMEKLKNGDMVKEKCERKDYVKSLSVNDARNIFLKNTCMTRYVKMNYMSDFKYVKELWQCDSCQRNIDSMNHVMWCPSYRELRENRNLDDDKDLARDLHDVMAIRSKLNIQK
jgi:hypothetical protein